jgi:DNA-directed RNA polymerase specialized sigma24 family protein
VSGTYSDLLRVARRCSNGPEQARDLVQTALAEALARGFADWNSVARRSWLYGVIRRRAAFEARTEARTRRRERAWQLETDRSPQRAWAFTPALLGKLRPSVRIVALLIQADLGPSEIQALLRLTGVALRQRLRLLRRALATEAAPRMPAATPQGPGFGPRRAAVLRTLRSRKLWAVASHDPDGHPLIFVAARSQRSP